MSRALRFGLVLAVVVGAPAWARDFYFDATNGSDSNAGTSSVTAWKTLIKLQALTLGPGDRVFFRAGDTYDAGAEGTLGIRIGSSESGAAGNPILFSSWGTGARPILRNARTGSTSIFYVQGSYITIDGLHLTQASDSAIILETTSQHDVVRNCEFENLGIGIAVYGQYSLITGNYFHDLLMVRNTQTPTDDDYGANAMVISGSHHEVSYNLAERLIAMSYDYGVDGGFCEIYSSNGSLTDLFIHHNIVRDSDGFSETGGQLYMGARSSVSNVTYAYNLSVHNLGFLTLHNAASGNFDIDHANFVMENNTIVELVAGGGKIVWMPQGASPTPSMLVVRNNLIRSAMNTSLFSKSGFTHLNNLYHLTGGASIGFTADPSELTTNAMLLNETGGDYHLGMTSPAINAGLSLGYTVDLDGKAVPAGSAPDIGAYEYGSVPVSDAGSSFDAGPSVDAGSQVDAGRPDAGSSTDAGSPVDAGRPDAGLSVDAGSPVDAGRPDAGPSVDAGSPVDAGRSDAGSSTDAGISTDAGVLADAGSADAGQPVVDGGVSDAGQGTVDAGQPDTDAGQMVADAGAAADAGQTTSPDGGSTEQPPVQGCGCQSATSAGWLGALMLAALMRRRRFSRSCPRGV